MSKLSNIPLVAHQLSLVLHTAIDFGHKEDIGIGIIQRAATGAPRTSTLPMEEHKHGIERGQVRAKNVKTRERDHMFALILAMGLARSTLKRRCTTTHIKVQSVTMLCSLPAVVELIKYHRAHALKSLESVVSTEDRSMIKRVLASVKRLSRYNVQISVVEDGEEGNTVEATRVKMMARQRKKKAYRRRRHARRIMSTNVETADDEEEDGGSDDERNGVGDGEQGRKDSSHLGPMTEIESSSTFMMDFNLSSDGGCRKKQRPKPARTEGANTPKSGRGSTADRGGSAETYCVSNSPEQLLAKSSNTSAGGHILRFLCTNSHLPRTNDRLWSSINMESQNLSSR